jgi:hypothetical protein
MKFRPEIIREIVAHEPEIRRNQIEAMCRKAAAALDSAAGLTESDPAWLWKLKIKGKRALDEKEVEREFMDAAKNSDNAIFLKAATALSSPVKKDADFRGDEISKVQWLLLEQWLAKENAAFFRSLCYYNDKALAKLVAFLLNCNLGESFPEKNIRNVWKRLGLKKSTRLLFCDVEILPGKPAMPVPYKVIQSPD